MNANDGKQRILIIDDTPAQIRALRHMLSTQYDVRIAKDGARGLELARSGGIDLILLDLVMPDLSGLDVISKLKEAEETQDIPVIFITSSESSEDEVEGLARGAVDYIRKPFVDAVVHLRVGIHLKMNVLIKAIEQFSMTDGLTGVSNRRGFDQTIKAEWARAARAQEQFGMLMIDIDRFKMFNDKYGHLDGDICLREVASAIQRSVMRGSDFVFRWGGEEFAVLLPNTSLEGAISVAERIRENIESTPIRCADEVTFVTASIGVGVVVPAVSGNSDNDNIVGFCTQIDKALYRAKENGRNRVEAVMSFMNSYLA
ncbi:MAG: diguanylate cyclase [Defluviitaleaceae bacterium]|nr:diguanylate cyclase [Defluviitaleaceae bacterium]